MNSTKSEQLQIRVSTDEKALLRRMAKDAKVSLSEFVLSRVLGEDSRQLHAAVQNLTSSNNRTYAFAELHDVLAGLSRERLSRAIEEQPRASLDSYTWNYLAAMIEVAAGQRGVSIPDWVTDIKPLSQPRFGTTLESLRLHLLTSSPLPFRRRNIFIDASIGDRV